MTLSLPGSAAGAIEMPRQRDAATHSDFLLESVKRGLLPGDPVGRLLAALLTTPTARPVQVFRARG